MDYQGNSKKSKEENNKEEKVIEKVVTGEVVTRKRPLGKRAKEIFFGGEAKSVTRYIGAEVLLPALRDLIVDATSKGIRKMVYGDSSVTSQRETTWGTHRPYYNYSRGPADSRARDVRPSRAHVPDQPSRPRSRRNGIEIILSSREEAELVLEQLSLILDKYEVTSIADLHELVGLPTTHVDQTWGWVTLVDVEIRQIREGYLLDLPEAEPIK